MTSSSPDGSGELMSAVTTGFELSVPKAHRNFATRVKRVLVLLLMSFIPFHAEAQNASPPPATEDQQLLRSEQLDALVAPVALYPDALLAQVLMASTYPLEIVQADRWVAEHKDMDGDRLKQEAEKQGWDDSVKSLVATPSVLSMMNSKLDWTEKLGDAVLAQQPDVMDAVQRLRSRAYTTNKLQSTKEQNVTVRQEGNKQIIAIAPTNPDTIYVPYYDPAVVYGEWPYPDYPPYYFPQPSYIASGILATGIAFGAGYALGRWTSGARFWGGSVNWSGGAINVNRGAHVTHWQHNPQHRRGVAYNNANVRQRFAGNAVRPGNRGSWISTAAAANRCSIPAAAAPISESAGRPIAQMQGTVGPIAQMQGTAVGPDRSAKRTDLLRAPAVHHAALPSATRSRAGWRNGRLIADKRELAAVARRLLGTPDGEVVVVEVSEVVVEVSEAAGAADGVPT